MTKSLYADRDTVGTMYRDLQLNGPKDHIDIGDMTREVMSSLIEDLNETIMSNPFEDRPFYICVHEKKDLIMPSMLLRRMLTTLYRPWPEDDTTVFYTDPKKNETLFCWCIPHWSEMDNMLNNEAFYDAELVRSVKAWKNMDLHHFGFKKDDIGNWIPNEHYKDKPLQAVQPVSRILLP